MKNIYNFRPASIDEELLFGACRPGYGKEMAGYDDINLWCDYMRSNRIERVVVLLDRDQLKNYSADYIEVLRDSFGSENILSTPIPDYHLATAEVLGGIILPFLQDSINKSKKTVVHCAGGIGRSGHILAAFLSCIRGYRTEDAFELTQDMGFNPFEAVDKGNATRQELLDLIDQFREKH